VNKKLCWRVPKTPSGRPLVLRGIFLSGVHEAENPHDWIARVPSRLALRCAEKPATKASQIKALWPEIDAALERGRSMKSIRKLAGRRGRTPARITSLTSYIGRIRRRETAAKRGSEGSVGQFIHPRTEPTPPLPSPRGSLSIRASTQAAPAKRDDPLAQAMSVLSKPRLDSRKATTMATQKAEI
jgi:hypothetical protein